MYMYVVFLEQLSLTKDVINYISLPDSKLLFCIYIKQQCKQFLCYLYHFEYVIHLYRTQIYIYIHCLVTHLNSNVFCFVFCSISAHRVLLASGYCHLNLNKHYYLTTCILITFSEIINKKHHNIILLSRYMWD